MTTFFRLLRFVLIAIYFFFFLWGLRSLYEDKSAIIGMIICLICGLVSYRLTAQKKKKQ